MKKIASITTLLLSAIIVISFSLHGCGSSGENVRADEEEMDTYLQEFQERLTPFKLEHGIGPITERIEIDDEINQDMVLRGREIYTMKCEVCHSTNQESVGPSLGNAYEQRSPEFIMNFILNPGENVLNHPIGLDLLAEHNVQMPYRDVTRDEARAVYEFLRAYYGSE